MLNVDLINGIFEFCGAAMNFINVRALLRDKKVHGVSILPTAFFTSWGFWNLFYYPSLDQWWSFSGGLFIVIANAAWITLAMIYTGTWRNICQRSKQTSQRLTSPLASLFRSLQKS